MPGEKLIDHLKKWLEPDKVVNVPHSWEVGEEAAVAAATLNLFHLLPTQASKFLETSVSPFTACLMGCSTLLRAHEPACCVAMNQ